MIHKVYEYADVVQGHDCNWEEWKTREMVNLQKLVQIRLC